MTTYTKAYTRENSLFAIQVWEEHQGRRFKRIFGEEIPVSVFDAHKGVVSVYYDEHVFEKWQDITALKIRTDVTVVESLLRLYETQINDIEKIWHKGIFDTKEELVAFFDFASEMWVGLSVSYCLPDAEGVSKEFQDLGMKLRERSVDFLDNTDRVILASLRKFYPQYNELVKYLSIEEISGVKNIDVVELEKREKHYVYFNFDVYTDVSDIYVFSKKQGIEIHEEEAPTVIENLKGQIAMKGLVRGVVRVLHSKSEIPSLIEGEVLVTAMTTPDYLPAMNKASAFVTDEGGITCHAAIVSRELKKPCIIGTKIATQVLKDGDLVEVDAEKGIVRILKCS